MKTPRLQALTNAWDMTTRRENSWIFIVPSIASGVDYNDPLSTRIFKIPFLA